MKSKRYFKIGQYAYHGNNDEFIIDTSKTKWTLFHRSGMPFRPNWKPAPCDSTQLKIHVLETARPDTWQKESHAFLKKNQVHYAMDYTSIEAEWNFGDGVVTRSYRLGCYDEGLLVGLRESKGVMEYLVGLLNEG